ncbi:unnamed protein product [Prorocentrum cordatum]|uniref:Selenoprotein O n=1 Tax=Prorocentrum cordatum TaxID=2364126 RepID=A0ABN9SKD5_9DINO|nr:unnamed protein product [Polarella glacialis]
MSSSGQGWCPMRAQRTSLHFSTSSSPSGAISRSLAWSMTMANLINRELPPWRRFCRRRLKTNDLGLENIGLVIRVLLLFALGEHGFSPGGGTHNGPNPADAKWIADGSAPFDPP